MTTQPPLIPRPPRKMRQPRKDELRRRLEVAQAQAAFDATPLWWRLWHRVWVRLVEVDAPHSPPTDLLPICEESVGGEAASAATNCSLAIFKGAST